MEYTYRHNNFSRNCNNNEWTDTAYTFKFIFQMLDGKSKRVMTSVTTSITYLPHGNNTKISD